MRQGRRRRNFPFILSNGRFYIDYGGAEALDEGSFIGYNIISTLKRESR